MIDERAAHLKDSPNMSEEVLNFLKSVIKKSDRILEFGSGGSTIWFAKNAQSVMSFESQINWYKAVKKRLKELNLDNVDLRFEPNYIRRGYHGANGIFDFILVDSQAWMNGNRLESRALCIRTSYTFLKHGGWLLLDDSSTKICKNAVTFMNNLGWKSKAIDGSFDAKVWRRP